MKKAHPDFKEIPVFYFSQIMALALGLEEKKLGLEHNRVSPYEILKEYNLL